ncbi:MAG TPA: S1/P1 nuclease [Pyrinomonadaceae bacterium]|jgi:hypothetical protein
MYTNAKSAPARRALACCAALCLVLLLPPRAAAWADDGHKTVAVVGYRLLTPKARQNVDAVLQGLTVDAVVMWPDKLRYINPGCVTPESSPTCGDDYRPETGNWHQVDLAYEGPGKYGPDVCPSTRYGDCVVAAIEDFKKILRNAARNKFVTYREADKRKFHDALRFMLHFVGDIHQPLHCANKKTPTGGSDAGGNGLPVTWQGEPPYPYPPAKVWNLHSLWDDILVEREIKRAGKTGFADYAAWLETTLTQAQKDYATRKTDVLEAGQAETTAAWAERSHRLAKQFAYDALPKMDTWVDKSTRGEVARDFNGQQLKIALLDEGYFVQGMPIVRQQLALGGVRLARILNEIFDRDVQ